VTIRKTPNREKTPRIVEEERLSKETPIRKRHDFHSALANLERLKIVDKLMNGEICQCDIFPDLGLSQSTVSAYLSQLVHAGVLKVRKDGTRKMYSIANKKMKDLLTDINKVVT
jgi:DNA-binding transcriptional ArsR family regulator